jgi:hypothetical protein
MIAVQALKVREKRFFLGQYLTYKLLFVPRINNLLIYTTDSDQFMRHPITAGIIAGKNIHPGDAPVKAAF